MCIAVQAATRSDARCLQELLAAVFYTVTQIIQEEEGGCAVAVAGVGQR